MIMELCFVLERRWPIATEIPVHTELKLYVHCDFMLMILLCFCGQYHRFLQVSFFDCPGLIPLFFRAED